MSVNSIVGPVPVDKKRAFRNRLVLTSGAGALIGGVYTASNKRYLYKGFPSDTFVTQVSSNLRKKMSDEELKESSKVYRFVEKAVKPDVELESLKPLIFDSKELSEAIKETPDEKVEDAVSRVFAQPDKNKVKQDLLNLQYKTKSNKKNGRTASMKLLTENFNAEEGRLVKSCTTNRMMFDMLKKTAKKIQIKSVAVAAVVTGIVGGAIGLVSSDIPGDKK